MIAETINRLKSSVPGLKLVGGAAEFQSAAETNPKATPAAFVIPMEENPLPSEVANLVVQRVRVTLGVILVVRNVTDAKGAAAQQDMTALRTAVKNALMGWEPTDGLDPLERGQGRLASFKDGHMWWQDIYHTEYFDRSNP